MENERHRAEEDRELPRVTEDRMDDAGSDDENEKSEDRWLESGAEDPAFFIKPSDDD